jgi:hypothetical protein
MVLGLGAAVGLSAGVLAAALPLGAPQLLTRDALVWPHMASVAGLMITAMFLTAADVASTGVLLACRWGPFTGVECSMGRKRHASPFPWHSCSFLFGRAW